MEYALFLITHVALFSLYIAVIIAIAMSEVKERRRESNKEVEAIECQKIEHRPYDCNPLPLNI